MLLPLRSCVAIIIFLIKKLSIGLGKDNSRKGIF
jgi:hypothetical protein